MPRPRLSKSLGYVLIVGAVFLGMQWSSAWSQIGNWVCITMSALLLLSTLPFLGTRIQGGQKDPLACSPSDRIFAYLFHSMLIVLSGPLVLFALTTQSQFNPKIETLSLFPCFPLFTEKGIYFCLPWFILSALAVFSHRHGSREGKLAWLPDVAVSNPQQHPRKFLHSAYVDLLHISITCLGLILLISALGLLNHGLTRYLDIHAIWQAPLRNTLFVFGIVMFSYGKRYDFLKKYSQRGFSLGAIFIIYFFVLSLALLGFEGFMRLAGVPVQESQLLPEARPLLAVTNQAFIEGLLLFWPLLFIPYINPILCRLNLGLRVWQALLFPLIIPSILYLGILPYGLNILRFLTLIAEFQSPAYSLVFSGILAYFLYSLFQHVHQHLDLHLGSLPKAGSVYKERGLFLTAAPLIKTLFYWIPLTLISGWRLTQISLFSLELALLSALVITTLVVLRKGIGFVTQWTRSRIKTLEKKSA